MKDETQSLVEDIKILSDGLIHSLEKGNIQESNEYVKKISRHLVKVQEYLEMKKAIDEN
jgi:predicted translin family RNA/ssDNA-binding protein